MFLFVLFIGLSVLMAMALFLLAYSTEHRHSLPRRHDASTFPREITDYYKAELNSKEGR